MGPSRAIGRRLTQAGLVAGALAVATVWIAPATASPASWTPVYTLTTPRWEGQDSPVVATDRYGDSLLAWVACNETTSGCLDQVQAKIRSRRGRMERTEALSPMAADLAWPQAATGDNGASAVVWFQNGRIAGRRVSASGKLSPLRMLSPKGDNTIDAAVAAGPGGQALVVWSQQHGTGGWYTQARYLGVHGSLGRELTLGAGTTDLPAVGIDRTGTAVVAWTQPDSAVVARRLTPGHVSRLRTIMPAAGGAYGMVSLGDGGNGDAVICAMRSYVTGSHQYVQLMGRRWRHTGRLGSVLHVAPTAHNVTFYHAVGSDRAGDAVVTWSQYVNSTQSAVFARRISRTGRLGQVTRLGLGDRPEITVEPAGAGLIAWQSLGSYPTVIKVYGSRFGAKGSFGRRFQISADGRVVRISSGWSGRFAAIWQKSTVAWPIRARFGP